jgi:hypothetical protein
VVEAGAGTAVVLEAATGAGAEAFDGEALKNLQISYPSVE